MPDPKAMERAREVCFFSYAHERGDIDDCQSCVRIAAALEDHAREAVEQAGGVWFEKTNKLFWDAQEAEKRAEAAEARVSAVVERAEENERQACIHTTGCNRCEQVSRARGQRTTGGDDAENR